MAHVFLPSFNEKCQENGWCADAEIRRYLGKHTLRLVDSTVQDDDIFLLSDADELFLPEVLLFLKLYNGYVSSISSSECSTGVYYRRLRIVSISFEILFLRSQYHFASFN